MSKIRKRATLDIDLTPLLDVIFIVLMIVMCSRQMQVKDLTKALDNATGKETVSDNLSWAEENEENLVANVSLYANYETGNPRIRHIYLAYEGVNVIDDITITPETELEAYDNFRDKMRGFIQQHKDIPVMLVLNEDQILYRDKIELDKLIDELSIDSNLYHTMMHK